MSRSKSTTAAKTASIDTFTDWKVGEGEEFYFMGRGFDVDAAKKILIQKPREMDAFNPEDLRNLIPPRNKFAIGVDIDYSKVDAGVDLTVPVIFAQVKGNSGKLVTLLIDGWHRVAAALEQGLTSLPCVVLTPAETKKIEI